MPEKRTEILFEKFFSEILKKSRFLQGFCKEGGRIIRVRNKEKNNKKTKQQQSKEEKIMFGFTALVVTLIATTVVGCGTGFAIVCITEI